MDLFFTLDSTPTIIRSFLLSVGWFAWRRSASSFALSCPDLALVLDTPLLLAWGQFLVKAVALWATQRRTVHSADRPITLTA